MVSGSTCELNWLHQVVIQSKRQAGVKQEILMDLQNQQSATGSKIVQQVNGNLRWVTLETGGNTSKGHRRVGS